MKICSKCRLEKNEAEFHKASSATDGLNYYCKSCNIIAVHKYRETHKEIINIKNKAYRLANPELRLLQSCKTRAKKDGLDFNLELSDIVIPDKCPLTGIKIELSVGVGRHRNNPSIDRVDNSKGYVKGNVRVVSDLGNRMKSDANREELINFAMNIQGYLDG